MLSICRFSSQSFSRGDKYNLYKEIQNILEIVGPIDSKPYDEVVRFCNIFNLCHYLLYFDGLFLIFGFLGRKSEICNYIFKKSSSVSVIF